MRGLVGCVAQIVLNPPTVRIKKTNETGIFTLSPVFVTLARNLGAFAKTSDDSGFNAGGSS
jgi:hypothetical protein